MTEQTETERPSQALTKFDDETLKGILPSGGVQRAVFLPANFAEALEMSKMLASGIGVRPWCRGNVSACMMIVQQAVRWGMDPYAVANKAYYVNDQVAFEAQLVNAVVNTSREIIGRLDIQWKGDGEAMVCTVSGRLKSDPEHVRTLDQPISTVEIRKSPLWKVNQKLQLAYHTTRSWARLYVPEVLLGVYTPDELADGATMMLEAKTTPATGKAPDRRDFAENAGPDAEDADFEPVDAENGENMHETAGNASNSVADDAQPEKTNMESVPKEDKIAGRDEPIDGKLPLVPTTEEGWSAWERDTLAAIDGAKDTAALQEVSKSISFTLEGAEEGLKSRVQEALTDGFADVAGS